MTATPSGSSPVAPVSPDELEIHTIPESYYGAALKAHVVEEKKPMPEQAPSASGHRWLVVGLVIILVLGIGGGFVYFNRSLLFPKPAVTPPVTTPTAQTPPPVPVSPSGISVTSTNPQSVLLSWTDASANESGFRIERNDGSGTFIALSNLPPNSTSFLDASVQPKTTYVYRVRAVNVSGESDPSAPASVTTPDLPPPPPEAPKLPPAGLDTDSDGLTDLEESLYGSNVRNPDTDLDGFLDGNEVFHLYNPSGKAPGKLLELALIRTVEAPIGWTMGIPASWTLKFDSQNGSYATIDSKHGESFVVSVEENPDRSPVLEWYIASHPGVDAGNVLQYRSKGGYTGIIGADLLSTYIPWGDKIFVLTYQLNGQPFINYRTTYSMMLNSLMLSGLPLTPVPTPGERLPFEPSATTSGIVTQPVPVEEAVSSTSSTKP